MINNHITWWVLLVMALCAIFFTVPENISVTVEESFDRYEILEKGRQFLQANGVDLEDYNIVTTRPINYQNIAYVISARGIERTRHLINQDSIPGVHWETQFLRDIPRDQPQTRYLVWISPKGKVTGFRRFIPDTMTIHSISESEALSTAKKFISRRTDLRLSRFNLETSQQIKLTNRTDYTFVWEKPASFAQGTVQLQLTIQGDEIGRYESRFEIPENIQTIVSAQTTKGTFLFLVQVFILFALFIFALVLFLKKYHEGEVSISLGRNLFLILFFIGLVRSINELPVTGTGISIGNMSLSNIQILGFFYEVLLQNVFLGILALTSWAVGESYARSLWPEKLNSIDSVLNKRFFTLTTGNAMLRGGAIGFIIAAVFLSVSALITGSGSDIVQVFLPIGDVFQYFIPAVTIVLSSMMMALLSEIVFRFFIINIVHHRWNKKWLSILVSSIVWTAGYATLSSLPFFSQFAINFALAFILGVVLAWLYFKFDLLTLVAANAATHIVFLSLPLIVSDAAWHRLSLYLLFAIILFPVAQIVLSVFRRETFQFSNIGLPKHIRRISERERMQKELEIARNVQMGLLPKENPAIDGFDISGICKPAKEVGGDYFDFVHLGKKKLGIAVGDVSGKGVPAAIYMTLTKGILQSHADESVSPKLVLNKVNKLLYRNIEKNSFVSMFYAILDLQSSSLTFARAGHNPGIMINQSDGNSEFLSTDGIALGLEEGNIFDSTLKEHTISLKPGDTLVFYTDGFTEAMNTHHEEYGDDRFVEIIRGNRHLSAQQLIERILKEVDSFAGDSPQHDDMTIVVVKIL